MAGIRMPEKEDEFKKNQAEFNENVAAVQRQIWDMQKKIATLDIPTKNKNILSEELSGIQKKLSALEKAYNSREHIHTAFFLIDEAKNLNKAMVNMLLDQAETLSTKTVKGKKLNSQETILRKFIIDEVKAIAVQTAVTDRKELGGGALRPASEVKIHEIKTAVETKSAAEKAKSFFESSFPDQVSFLQSRLTDLKNDLANYSGKNGKILEELKINVNQMLQAVDKLSKDREKYNRIKDNPLAESATRESMEKELNALTKQLDTTITATLTRKTSGGFFDKKTVISSDTALTAMLNEAKSDSARSVAHKFKGLARRR